MRNKHSGHKGDVYMCVHVLRACGRALSCLPALGARLCEKRGGPRPGPAAPCRRPLSCVHCCCCTTPERTEHAPAPAWPGRSHDSGHGTLSDTCMHRSRPGLRPRLLIARAYRRQDKVRRRRTGRSFVGVARAPLLAGWGQLGTLIGAFRQLRRGRESCAGVRRGGARNRRSMPMYSPAQYDHARRCLTQWLPEPPSPQPPA